MAEMMPDRLPSGASAGERKVFALLQQGAHVGRFAFPFGHLVVLNNCTREQLDERGLSEVFPARRVLARDELEALSPDDTINRRDARLAHYDAVDTSERVTIRAICGSPLLFHQAKARRDLGVHDTHPFAACLAQPVGDRQPERIGHQAAILEAVASEKKRPRERCPLG